MNSVRAARAEAEAQRHQRLSDELRMEGQPDGRSRGGYRIDDLDQRRSSRAATDHDLGGRGWREIARFPVSELLDH